jgi:hypothetical protein
LNDSLAASRHPPARNRVQGVSTDKAFIERIEIQISNHDRAGVPLVSFDSANLFGQLPGSIKLITRLIAELAQEVYRCHENRIQAGQF